MHNDSQQVCFLAILLNTLMWVTSGLHMTMQYVLSITIAS